MWKMSVPLWAWAISSAFARTQAWLVDALTASGYLREGGSLEAVLAQGEIVPGLCSLLSRGRVSPCVRNRLLPLSQEGH
jgi:hypothetical protein